jgi:hypothetical protein
MYKFIYYYLPIIDNYKKPMKLNIYIIKVLFFIKSNKFYINTFETN